MKFKISLKELKNVIAGIEKAVTKKAKLEIFETVQFKREGKDNIVFEAQNMNGDVFGILRLLNTEVYDFEVSDNKESFNLDLKDLKEIVKIKTNYFVVSDVSDNKVMFDAGKKKIVVNKKTNNNGFIEPVLQDQELICSTTCNDLLDSFTRLSKALSKDNNVKAMTCYHLCNKYMESLDGHVVIRKTTNEKETCFCKDNADLLINGKDFGILKNVLTQNKDKKLNIYADHKYYCISCEEFSYIGQRIEGKPFNTKHLFEETGFNKNVVVDTNNFLEVVNYNAKINKNYDKPTILGVKNNQLFSYHSICSMESFDIIETKETNIENGFYIGFNPDYLQNIFSILAADETEMKFLHEKAPVHIKSGDIMALVLPILINGGFDFNSIDNFFEEKIFGNFEKKTEEKLEETEKLEEVEEVEEVEEFKPVFYTINEKTAKMANDINSFSDYTSGSATEIYTKEITEFFEKVDNLTKGKEEKRTKLYNKCCSFSKKLADYYNAFYSNEASCPSVLISGGGNFPVGKKNKQNNKRETLVNDCKYLQEYKKKIIASAKNDAIMSSDANAIQKLEEKIKNLKELQEKMKLANKFLRKKDVLAGDKGLLEMGYTQSQVQELRKTDFCGRIGFSSYTLTNNNANIKRLEKRLENLKKTIENSSANNEEEHDDFKIVRNTDLMRLQLFFDDIPCDKTRDILKRNGFRWSPKNKAWQRMLNYNAERALDDFKKNYTEA